MSEILSPEDYEREWWDILETRQCGYESYDAVRSETKAALLAHDAALRAALAAAERERDALRLGTSYTGTGEIQCGKCGATLGNDGIVDALTEVLVERDSLRARLREVASAGVEFDDQRLDYVTVQIDRETWGAVRALGTGAARSAMPNSDEGHE